MTLDTNKSDQKTKRLEICLVRSRIEMTKPGEHLNIKTR
ncbi:MAG: hypothetical protein RL007_1589 [Bacteroidota bacterium]|jgi:hypothetical protein